MNEKTSLVRHPSAYRSNPTAMEEEVHHLFNELRNIFEQYQKEVPGKRRPWPESIRERILKLWSLGVTSHQISEECKMPAQTLYSWRQRLKKQKAVPGFSEIPLKRSKRRTNFQIQQDEIRHSNRLQLSQLESLPTMQPQVQQSVILTLPSGVKIEGLNFEQIKDLLQRLEGT